MSDFCHRKDLWLALCGWRLGAVREAQQVKVLPALVTWLESLEPTVGGENPLRGCANVSCVLTATHRLWHMHVLLAHNNKIF